MHGGFNLLLYGFGSKRRLLTEFAETLPGKVDILLVIGPSQLMTLAQVVVVNGFLPNLRLGSLLNYIAVNVLVQPEKQGRSNMERVQDIHEALNRVCKEW